MAIIGITYKEPDQSTYKSVDVCPYGKSRYKRFKSGDFIKDWWFMNKYLVDVLHSEPFYAHSSSLDHFICDGEAYESAYLRYDESGEPYLGYEYEHNGSNYEFFVKAGTRPTWKELVDYCKGR